MTAHIPEDTLNDIIDGRLSYAEESSSRIHLAECAGCASMAERIAAIITLAHSVRSPVMPDSNLWPRIASETIYRRRPGRRRIVLGLCVVIAMITAIAIIFWLIGFPGRSTVVTGSQPRATVGGSRVQEVRTDLHGASAFQSDADRIRVLRNALPVVAAGRNQDLWADFFGVVAAIQSDGDRSKMLIETVPYAASRPRVAILIIQSAKEIGSPANKTHVLVALAKTGAIDSEHLRSIYMDAAVTISSAANRSRAIEALSR